MSTRVLLKSLAASCLGMLQPSPRSSLAVLTYHSVGSPLPASLPTALFEGHLRYLRESAKVSVLDWRNKGSADPAQNTCLITFDDGYLDNYTQAAPVLERYGMKALFFLTTAYVDGAIDITGNFRSYGGLRPMSWDQVAKLLEQGHAIVLHGHSHRDFGRMSADEARDEFETSVEMFRQRTGVAPDSFAYPFGQFQNRRADLEELLAATSVRSIFTTDHTLAKMSDIADTGACRLIPRLRIDADDDNRILAQKINGSWDYIAALQRMRSCMTTHSLNPLLLNDR